MRNGQDYVEALRDGRAVYLDGELIPDVTMHPAFANQIRLTADTYDRAREKSRREELSYTDPATGQRFSSMWLVPKSADDLLRRRKLHEFWAEASYGLIGRSPDHVASTLTAFVASADVFARGGREFADNVRHFYERARREDLYLAYVIVPPSVDRSKPAHQQPEPFLYAGVSEERDDGIVIRGAQMLATSGAMADCAGELQCLLVVAGGLFVPAKPPVNPAEAG